MAAPERVEVNLVLLLQVLETLRLTHVYVLKDSHPEELGESFKRWKWDGHEKAFCDETFRQYERLFEEVRAQVPSQ